MWLYQRGFLSFFTDWISTLPVNVLNLVFLIPLFLTEVLWCVEKAWDPLLLSGYIGYKPNESNEILLWVTFKVGLKCKVLVKNQKAKLLYIIINKQKVKLKMISATHHLSFKLFCEYKMLVMQTSLIPIWFWSQQYMNLKKNVARGNS